LKSFIINTILSYKWLGINLIFLLLLFSSCAGIKKIDAHLIKEPSTINLAKESDKSIEITYSGCGGFLINNGISAILIDPYFSNTGPIPFLYFKTLKSDTTQIDRFFDKQLSTTKDKDGIIKAILVAHSHYDHLADVPSVFTRVCHADSSTIYGSKTTKHILASVGLEKNVCAINPDSLKKKNSEIEPNWIYTKNKQIRFLPINSEHAPHFWGKKMVPAGIISKDLINYPRRIQGFPEGDNFNFLIDFLDEQGEISFRIFSHAGAACNADIGIPSNEILLEKEIDVLLLCVGNYNQVIDYPEIVIGRTRPRFIIGNHWEDFFRSFENNQRSPKLIPGTNVPKFIEKVNLRIAELGLQNSLEFKLPFPNQTIRFNY